MNASAIGTRRGSVWIPASLVAVAWLAIAAGAFAADPGGTDTVLLACAVAVLSVAALLRPLEPAPGEKFSLAAAIAFFGALVLPGAQAVAAVAASELLARAARRSSSVNIVVNTAKSAGATGIAAAAAHALRMHPSLPPGLEEVVVAGALYLTATLAPIAVMIAWTKGTPDVLPFIAREWLPASTLVAIGALGAVIWTAMPLLIVLLALPLAMVEAAARSAARARETGAALARSFETQRAFVADAAHELRNPLAAVRGNLAFVRDAGLPDDERAALADARRDTTYVSTLVDRLLLLSRVDAAVDAGSSAGLSAIVRAAAEATATRAGVALDRAIDEGVAVALPPELVEALVRDLLANACAYTERGFVRVTVRRIRDRALLEVRDTGVGIDPAELPRVFDRFFRGAAARRLAPGSGLGLAIARRIVEAYGGTIVLTRPTGPGTLVTVTLPLATSQEGTRPARG